MFSFRAISLFGKPNATRFATSVSRVASKFNPVEVAALMGAAFFRLLSGRCNCSLLAHTSHPCTAAMHIHSQAIEPPPSFSKRVFALGGKFLSWSGILFRLLFPLTI